MHSKILGPVREIKVIAQGHGIRNINAEVHWYEAHGIGEKEIKLKAYL